MRHNKNQFALTGALHPPKTGFDLSHEMKGTCDAGFIIPIWAEIGIPGETLQISHELVMRLNPLVNPPMQEINAVVHSWAVPIRQLDEDFETFFTGGKFDGEQLEGDTINIPKHSGSFNKNSFADYIGLGRIKPTELSQMPCDYLLRAYNKIYNDNYRDQDLEPEIEYPYDLAAVITADLSLPDGQEKPYQAMGYYNIAIPDTTSNNLFWGNWEKDYFTACRPWQQKGASPALPIYGSAQLKGLQLNIQPQTSGTPYILEVGMANNKPAIGGEQITSSLTGQWTTQAQGNLEALFNDATGTVDLASASAGDINDLRRAVAVQRWMELNARAGTRMVEVLHHRYGTPILDVRLDRPEYIGGAYIPIIMSEVLQTSESETTTPNNQNQTGSMRGHGISATRNQMGKYHCNEFMILMTVMCIKPKASYAQGIDRQWCFNTRYDLPMPEFVNLGEQAVKNSELFIDGTNNDAGDFGYIPRYEEYRFRRSKITTGMRDDFDTWHLGRYFQNTPTLSWRFIKIDPSLQKRIFAVTSEHGYIYNIANSVRSYRPLPYMAKPGLIDHVFGG